jgi:hypothetical protein
VSGRKFRIEGHAIVSDDDRICDENGVMPASLKSEADWRYFQSHLDSAAIVITGRNGHEAHPNKPGRQRLIFTSRGEKPFRREGDIGFIDPSRFALEEAFEAIAPKGGIVAVTGGGPVFDWFAKNGGFNAFHLVRKIGLVLPSGRPVFADAAAEPMLTSLRLRLKRERWLSLHERVQLKLFSR